MKNDDGFGLEVSKGFVAKIILAVVGFAGSIVFARVLGPSGYGSFYIAVALANVFDNPITGLGNACKKRISEQGQDLGAILTIGLGVTLALGVGISVVLISLRSLGSTFPIPVEFVVVVFWGFIFFKVIQPMVEGRGQFGTAVVLDSIRSILTIPLQLALVLTQWGVRGMVYGLSAATALTALLSLSVLGVRPTLPERETVQSVYQYAKFSVPSAFVGTALSRLDILLLGAVVGSGASGQYRVAMQLVLPGMFLSMVMGSGLFTEVSSLSSRDDNVNTRVSTNVAFASLFAIPLLFGALAIPEAIVVTIYGGEYRSAATLLVGLAVYQIFRTQNTQLSSVLEGLDKPDVLMYITIGTLVVNVILGVWLVFLVGTLGVVIATVVAEAMKYIASTYLTRRHVSYEIFPAPIKYQFIAAFAMFVIVEILQRLWGIQSWFDLVVIVGLGVIMYGAMLLLLSDIFLKTAKDILADARERYPLP